MGRRVPWFMSALVLAAVVAVTGCGGNKSDSAQQGGPPGRPGGPGGANGSAERPALPTLAVAVEPAERGSIATYYSATASLDPDKQADILARTSGVVQRLLAEEGDRVAKGSVLLHIEDDEYRHKVTLAEVDVDQNRLRYERAQKMVEQGLTSDENYEAARRDLRSAEAALELAQLELVLHQGDGPVQRTGCAAAGGPRSDGLQRDPALHTRGHEPIAGSGPRAGKGVPSHSTGPTSSAGCDVQR